MNYCRKSEPGPNRAAKIDLVARGLQNSLIDRVETYEFLPRIIQLLPNVTAFDAAYVVTAEAYQIPLITSDHRLSRSPGPRCDFVVF
jgi:predicted nucleic acid-binding protein